MTHGGPHPTSGANYVIICNGRIGAAAAKDPQAKILAASDCATRLLSHIEARHGDIDETLVKPISDLQHEMMETMVSMSREEAEVKVQQMFILLDGLEHEYSGAHEY